MKKTSRDYFNLSPIVSLILAIIPVSSLVLGIVTRLQEKRYVAAIIRILLGWNIIWFLDLLCIIFTGRIFSLLEF